MFGEKLRSKVSIRSQPGRKLMATLKWESYFIFSVFVFSVASVVSSRQKDTCWISHQGNPPALMNL